SQERLWFLDRLEPGRAVYNMAAVLEAHGALDVAALGRSLSEIVRRHESLRTRFVEDGGLPVQVIEEAGPFVLDLVDLSGLAAAEREAEAWQRLENAARRPFDLGSAPLLRALPVRLGVEEHRLLLATHHIVSDGASVAVLIGELRELYEAYAAGRPSPLPEPAIQYGDFAVWQR